MATEYLKHAIEKLNQELNHDALNLLKIAEFHAAEGFHMTSTFKAALKCVQRCTSVHALRARKTGQTRKNFRSHPNLSISQRYGHFVLARAEENLRSPVPRFLPSAWLLRNQQMLPQGGAARRKSGNMRFVLANLTKPRKHVAIKNASN